MVASIFLLLLLFIAGLFTTNLPTKKFFAWFIVSSIKSPSSFAPNSKTAMVERPTAKDSMKDEIIKRVFATFDKNSDGFITKQELRVSLTNIGMAMEESEVEDLIKKVDANGDGLIDLSEFRESFELLLNKGEVNKEDGREEDHEDVSDKERDLLREAFDVFDEDKDGLITVEELSLVLSSMGFEESSKLEDCKKMITSVDMDGDGMVNFDEFKMMMRTGQGSMPVS